MPYHSCKSLLLVKLFSNTTSTLITTNKLIQVLTLAPYFIIATRILYISMYALFELFGIGMHIMSAQAV